MKHLDNRQLVSLCRENGDAAALIKENVHPVGGRSFSAECLCGAQLNFNSSIREQLLLLTSLERNKFNPFPPPTKTDSLMKINLGLVIQQTFRH